MALSPMPKKKFQLYAHHNYAIAPSGAPKGSGGQARRLFKAAAWPVFKLCYALGLVIYRAFLGIGRCLSKEAGRTADSVRLRAKAAKQVSWLKTGATFLLTAVIALAALSSLRLLAQAIALKERVIAVGQNAGNVLLQAKADLQDKNFDQAESKFELA